MSKPRQTDDPPRSDADSDAGPDAARAEEVLAALGEQVHELESVASELRSELRELRAERTTHRPRPAADVEDWPVDASFAPSPDWVANVPPPLARSFAVPRIAVEAVFLLAVALLAGLANLSAPWIVLVMSAAWALVVLSEWSAAAARARWRLEEVAPSLGGAGAGQDETTGPWSMPVVEATAVARADGSESRTVIATLPEPAPAEAAAPAEEAAPVEEPGRRRLGRWRRPVAKAGDPWEV